MIRELDIDTLHTATAHILNGTFSSYQHRRRRITTAFLYLMLGEVWVGNRGVTRLYVGKNSQDAKRVMAEFIDLLISDGNTPITYCMVKLTVTTEHQVFKFVSITRMIDGFSLAGLRAEKVFFDQDLSLLLYSDTRNIPLTVQRLGAILV
jgi:hypothetical protein